MEHVFLNPDERTEFMTFRAALLTWTIRELLYKYEHYALLIGALQANPRECVRVRGVAAYSKYVDELRAEIDARLRAKGF